MAEMSESSLGWRLARFVIRRAYGIVALWLLFAITVYSTAPRWSSLALDGDFDYLPANMPSVSAERILNQAFPRDRARSQIAIVIGRDHQAFDSADELVALDLLRHLHHRLAEVLIQRSQSIDASLDDQRQQDRQNNLLDLARQSLDEALEIDESYFTKLQSTANRERVPVDSIRLIGAYWDRANLLQSLGDDTAAAPDFQAALTLDPDYAKRAIAIGQRDLQPWSSLLDILSWNDAVLGGRLLHPHSRLIILQSDAELAATHNIDFLAAVHTQINTSRRNHQELLRPGLDILATGSAAIGGESLTAAAAAIRYTELFTILSVLAILALVYRAPLLIAIPLLTIGLAVLVSLGSIAWLTDLSQRGWLPGFQMQVYTTSRIFLFVLLFGIGTDFCLFLIARVREEAHRWPWQVASINALAGVSSALVGSAMTTIVGLGMLWIAQFGKYHHTGPMIAICLFIGLMICLTLTPAVIYLLGPRVFWPQSIGGHAVDSQTPQRESRPISHPSPTRERGGHPSPTRERGTWPENPRELAPSLTRRARKGKARLAADSTGQPQGIWGWIAWQVTRAPGATLAVGITLLLIPAVHGYQHQDDVTYDISSQLDASAESRRGFRRLDEHFGTGEVAPTTVLMVRDEPLADKQLAELAKSLSIQLYDQPGVRAVRSADDPLGDFPPDRQMSLLSKDAWKRRALKTHRAAQGHFFSDEPQFAGRLVRLDVVLTGNPFEVATGRDVSMIGDWLRDLTQDADSPWADTEVFLAGTTPSIIDLRTVTQADHHRIRWAVIIAVFLVLVIVIRRVVLCGYLIATVMLSYFATLGLTLVFFQWLYGADYLGLDWKLPFFLFVILVAVGQDYNVYLVTRVLEEQHRRLGWLSALRFAVARTGGIITACGVVMAFTFFSMTASAWVPGLRHWLFGGEQDPQAMLKGIVELGFALGLGILIDTFYVRTILVPAFIAKTYRTDRSHPKPDA